MHETRLKLVVLYADISGSTRIYEQYGDAVARHDIAACLDLLSETAARHQGKTIKTIGDEIMCVFSDPLQAADAAADMQRDLGAAGAAHRFQSEPLHVKIAWHYGYVTRRRDDVIGEAPIYAQRLMKVARRDEVLTTGTSLGALPPAFTDKARFLDMIEAGDGHGQIDVYSLPWEEDTAEITQVSSIPLQSGALVHDTLQLNYEGNQLQLDHNHSHCTIGRGEDNDLVINGDFISRHHAEIYYRHGRFHLVDMSTNGTAVIRDDGHRVRLHRGEDMLSGSGVICCGGKPDSDPGARIRYECQGKL